MKRAFVLILLLLCGVFSLSGDAQITQPAIGNVGTSGQVLLSNAGASLPSFSDSETVVTSSVTGNQNGAWFTLPGGRHVTVYLTNASLLTVQSIPAGYSGQTLDFISQGAGQVDLSHSDASGTSGQKLNNFATSGKTSLAAGVGTARFIWDATNTRWNLAAHEQGAWITRTFSAGNYAASSGTWTVASATDAYLLRGRTMIYSFGASGTTSGTPVTVKIALPLGVLAASSVTIAYYVSLNGSGGSEGGYGNTASANNILSLQRFANTTFGAGTVTILGEIAFDVQ